MKPIALVTLKILFWNSSSGRIGSAARLSTTRNRTRPEDAEHEQHDHLGREPGVRRAAEAREQHDRRQRGREQRRAEIVDPVGDGRRLAVEHGGDHEQGHRPDRQVDVEDPAPAQVVDEEAAEQRADDGRDAEDAAEEAGVAAALARRDDVADDGHRRHHQAAGAETLQRAEPDQLRHRLAGPAERGADQEEDDGELEHRLAAVEVAELPVQRPGHRRRQQVAGHHPRDVLEPVQVADDRRQRGRDDRLVERREQQDEHQRAEDQADARCHRLGRGGLLLRYRGHVLIVPAPGADDRRWLSPTAGSSSAPTC